jgi:hypothetical protein
MNAPQSPSHLSPVLGEASTCLEFSRSPLSLLDICAQLSRESAAIVQCLSSVLDLPRTGVGLIACCSTLLSDLATARSTANGEEYATWHSSVAKLQVELSGLSNVNEAQDRVAMLGLRRSRSSLLLTMPTVTHAPGAAKVLCVLRTRLVLHYVSAGRPVSTQAVSSFVALLANQDNEAIQLLLNQLTTTPADLKVLRSTLSPASPEARLLSALITALSTPLTLPFTEPPSQRTVVVPRRSKEATEDEEEEPDWQAGPNKLADISATDLIGIQLSSARFARPTDSAGVTGNADYLMAEELIVGIPLLIERLSGPSHDQALAAILTLLLNVRPRQWALVSLQQGTKTSSWLDISAGHYCWILDAAISRKKFLSGKLSIQMLRRPPVRIPLPLEVIVTLQQRLADYPNAANLADLFPEDSTTLEKTAKRLLREISPTSHHLTVERLQRSYGRFLLGICGDEALASAVASRFDLGTPANLNYWPLRARRIAHLVQSAYSMLGFSGRIQSSPAEDTGSLHMNCGSKLQAILSDSLRAASQSFSRIHNKSTEEQLIDTHNVISTAVFQLLIVISGHRNSVEAFFYHGMDLALKVAIVGDKRTLPYHCARVVPLPEVAVVWIRFYLAWLESLRYRLRMLCPTIARHCDSVVQSSGSRTSAPLFFAIDRKRNIRAIGTKALRKSFSRYQLPENAGRHWVCSLLVDGGVESATVMAHAGRGTVGQEAFGARSCLDPMSVVRTVGAAINSAIGNWNLPSAPVLHARTCALKSTATALHTPYAFRTSSPVEKEAPFVEPCPFHELTLAQSRWFAESRAQWLTRAPAIDLGSLALSLVYFDLVVHPAELLQAIREVLTGPVYWGGETAFVDTDTRSLGIRRIWLHPVTTRLGAELSECHALAPDVEDVELTRQIEASIGSLCRAAALGEPMRQLLESATAYVALRAPGVMREWWQGGVLTRTLRPQCVARRQFTAVEHPQPAGLFRRRHGSGELAVFLQEALDRAMSTVEYGGGNEVRIRNLLEDLEPYADKPMGCVEDEVLRDFCVFLAHIVGAPSTIQRYITAVRPLVRRLCMEIESVGEISQAPWRQAVTEYCRETFTDSATDYSSERAAVNHLFDCFEIDRRAFAPRDPAMAARRYADQLSAEELERAVGVAAEMTPVEGNTELPETLLCVMADQPVRWGEISRVRRCDLLTAERPFLVLTHAAVGTQKSDNAFRVQALSSAKSIGKITKLAELRVQQFSEVATTFLACNPDNPMSVSRVDDVGEIINHALWRVTGSAEISAHDTRGSSLTQRAIEALDPATRNAQSLLKLRQRPYDLQVTAGHGDFNVTAANYLAEFDLLRRKWADHWIVEDGLHLSPNFTSALTGIHADTLRARVRRGGGAESLDPLEGFSLDEYPRFAKRVRQLSEMTVKGCQALPANGQVTEARRNVRGALRYMGLRAVGQAEQPAAVEAELDPEMGGRIDREAEKFCAKFGKRWLTKPCYSARKLRRAPDFVKIIENLAGWRPLSEERHILERTLPDNLDDAWRFSCARDVIVLNDLWRRLAESGVSVISGHDTAHLELAEDRLAMAGAGVSVQRSIGHRNFGDRKEVRVSFVPTGITDEAMPRKVRWASFQVAAVTFGCLLTSLLEA